MSSDEEVQEMGDFDDPGHVVVDVVVAMLLLPVFFGECGKTKQKNDVLLSKSGWKMNHPVCAPHRFSSTIEFWEHNRERKLDGEWYVPANNNIYKDTITYNNNKVTTTTTVLQLLHSQYEGWSPLSPNKGLACCLG